MLDLRVQSEDANWMADDRCSVEHGVELYCVSALGCVCGQPQERCVDTTPIVMFPAWCLFAWQVRLAMCCNSIFTMLM